MFQPLQEDRLPSRSSSPSAGRVDQPQVVTVTVTLTVTLTLTLTATLTVTLNVIVTVTHLCL